MLADRGGEGRGMERDFITAVQPGQAVQAVWAGTQAGSLFSKSDS